MSHGSMGLGRSSSLMQAAARWVSDHQLVVLRILGREVSRPAGSFGVPCRKVPCGPYLFLRSREPSGIQILFSIVTHFLAGRADGCEHNSARVTNPSPFSDDLPMDLPCRDQNQVISISLFL